MGEYYSRTWGYATPDSKLEAVLGSFIGAECHTSTLFKNTHTHSGRVFVCLFASEKHGRARQRFHKCYVIESLDL